MAITKIIDCGNDAENAVMNTGTKGFKSLGKVVRVILSTSEQKFENVDEFKDEAEHNSFAASKDIVYLYEVEKPENANTEDAYIESSINKELSQEGKKIKKYRFELMACDYNALLSIVESGKFTRIYEITQNKFLKGIANSDGSIRGMKVKNLILGPYNEATPDELENATLEVVYEDRNEFVRNPAIVKPSFDPTEKNGILDVALEVIGSPTSTTLVVKATSGCCGDTVESFIQANFVAKTTAGTAQPITDMTHDNGVYTLTGTFETGTIATNVVTNSNAMYEAQPITFTV